MSDEVKARLFEPFFTTKEVGKGTGLGLAMSYGIVRQASGHIGVYSEKDAGTAVRIYLPTARPGEPNVGPVERAHAPARGTETVLVVDDDASVRDVASRGLAELGYKVLTAASGEEAVRIGTEASNGVALLLADVVMPGMNGKAVAQALRAQRPELKVLFMSGYSDGSLTRHGALDPDVELVQKPFAINALAQRVRALLDLA